MYHLGLCYLNGNGVDKNQEVALDLFVDAARKGLTSAQQLLKENYLMR